MNNTMMNEPDTHMEKNDTIEDGYEIDLDKIDIPYIPDYPDWKRGLKWGLTASIPLSLAVFLISASVSLSKNGVTKLILSELFQAFVIFIMFFLLIGSIGAFRPQNYR
jgi:hypothetical protein